MSQATALAEHEVGTMADPDAGSLSSTEQGGAGAELTAEELEAAIVRTSCRLSAGEHRLLTYIRQYDEREEWSQFGAASMAHWLSWRIKIGIRAARERVRVARALATFPRVDEALRLGHITYCQARAITRAASPANEEALLELAGETTGAKLERIVRRYRQILQQEEGVEPERFVKTWDTRDGMVKLLVQLRPEEALVLRKAIDHLLRVHGRPGHPKPDGSDAPEASGCPEPEAEPSVSEDAKPASRTGRGPAEPSAAGDRATGSAEPISPNEVQSTRPAGTFTSGACRLTAPVDAPSQVACPSVGSAEPLAEGGGKPGQPPGSSTDGSEGPPTDGSEGPPTNGIRCSTDSAVNEHEGPSGPAPERSEPTEGRQRAVDAGLGPVPTAVWPDEPPHGYDILRATETATDTSPRFTRPDAVVALAEHYLDTQARQRRFVPGRFEVLVHVDPAALRGDADAPFQAELEDGTPIARETARRLACSAPRVVLVEDETGKLLDSGRRTRAISSALQRALITRDGGCRFPGCTNWRYIDAHHIIHWSDGGETKIENLVTLCRRHHVLVHEGGFGLSFTDEGAPRFTDRRGRALDPTPHWLLIEGGEVAYLADELSPGLPVDERSLRFDQPEYPPQMSAAVDGLMALAGYDYDPVWTAPAAVASP